MTMMILGALAIGLTLGLLGSGGSILTVPVLVYVLGHNEKVAIAESLAIVGAIAGVGMIPYARKHQVDWHSVLFFGLPGMGGTYLGAWLAKFVSGPVQLVFFALIMLLAAVIMFRRPRTNDNHDNPETSPVSRPRHPMWQIALEGLIVGIITGLVGVGGGFLIVPALVILGGLPMRLAVGTSLIIIALKSFIGFFKYVGVLDSLGSGVDWSTIAIFVAVGIAGSLIGNVTSQKINQNALKRGFAAFLVVMGIFVLGREVPHVFAAGPSTETAETTAAHHVAAPAAPVNGTPGLVDVNAQQGERP